MEPSGFERTPLPKFPTGLPESFVTGWHQLSPNLIYAYPLETFEESAEVVGEVLTVEQILSTAPSIHAVFGDGRTWTKNFLTRALPGCSVGVREKERIIGACLVGSQTPHVWAIYVLPEYRRQGLALGMLHHSMSRLKAGGFSTLTAAVRQTNKNSNLLFQKAGFVRKK